MPEFTVEDVEMLRDARKWLGQWPFALGALKAGDAIETRLRGLACKGQLHQWDPCRPETFACCAARQACGDLGPSPKEELVNYTKLHFDMNKNRIKCRTCGTQLAQWAKGYLPTFGVVPEPEPAPDWDELEAKLRDIIKTGVWGAARHTEAMGYACDLVNYGRNPELAKEIEDL